MSDEMLAEDATAEAALDLLQAPPGGPKSAAVGEGFDAADQVLVRQFTEVLGLLACELPPSPPPEGSRGMLLAHLVGDETQEIEPLRQRAPFDADLPPASARAAARAATVAAPAGRVRRWPLALAALLAIAVAGLGLWGFGLSDDLARKSGEVARLQGELDAAKRAGAEATAMRSELAALRKDLDFVTGPSMLCFTLRPAADAPAAHAAARGLVWVAPDHQHWYLRVHGLPAEPAAQDYQLWFLVGEVPVPAGTFDATSARPVTLSSERMPAGTTGVAITLEQKGGVPRPTGAPLLRADKPVQL